MIHYDSSKLSFAQVSDYIIKDNIINGSSSEPDTDDFDSNPSTDQYVTLGMALLEAIGLMSIFLQNSLV